MILLAPIVPLGLGAGRIGNFIGGELYGRPTDVPWAMIFPTDPLQVPRHPSQLYQAFLEGFVLFVILWVFSSKKRPAPAVAGLFCAVYAVFRFLVEFVRQPDSHIGFDFFGWMTRGQILSIPMLMLGIGFIVYAYVFANVDNQPQTVKPTKSSSKKKRKR